MPTHTMNVIHELASRLKTVGAKKAPHLIGAIYSLSAPAKKRQKARKKVKAPSHPAIKAVK